MRSDHFGIGMFLCYVSLKQSMTVHGMTPIFICLVKAPEEILERVYVSPCKLFCEMANRVVDTGDHNT